MFMEEQKPKSKKIIKELLEWVIYFIILMILTYLTVTYVGQRTRVEGDSMYPMLHDGDNLIVDKITYKFSDPERFDIVVFPYQYETNIFYIKRIIALPGETILIKDGVIYIDGEVLDEEYGAEVIELSGIAAEEIQLGDDEYFVLGDNRNHSKDSRDPSVGLLHEDDLVGRAWMRIWPFERFGVIKHE